MPYTRKVLISKGFQGIPKTVGEHILKKRLDDGLTQVELGERLGVDASTVLHWEKGSTKVIPAQYMAAVVAFLGYNPEPEPDTVGARLRFKRRSLGWTTTEAARRNSVDPSTWEAWEGLEDWPKYPRFREYLEEFLALPNDELADRVRAVRKAGARRGKNADHSQPSST